MKLAATMLLIACLGSCRPAVQPPPDVDDADAEDARVSPCARACERLHALGCPEGEPSRNGTSCLDVCRTAGVLVNAPCVARAPTIDAIHACNVRCAP